MVTKRENYARMRTKSTLASFHLWAKLDDILRLRVMNPLVNVTKRVYTGLDFQHTTYRTEGPSPTIFGGCHSVCHSQFRGVKEFVVVTGKLFPSLSPRLSVVTLTFNCG